MDEPMSRLHRSAMDVVLTWGPERLRPEIERLRERHPDADPMVAAAALEEGHRALADAEALAPAIKGAGPATTSKEEIRHRHPWLTDELLDRAVQQGLYFHWRDTGQ
jgi:hypothetical protein